MKAEDLIGLAEEKDVRFVNLQFSDLFGVPKNLSIPVGGLPGVLARGAVFDGSSIEGFVRTEESDMLLVPDAETFLLLPWRQQGRTARVICDVHADGAPFEGDPRFVLKKAIAEATAMGYTLNVGAECEFFLFHQDSSGIPTTQTQDDAGYFDLAPIDMGEEARRDICLTLEEMGFEIEASHHECAAGQHEIDLLPQEALCAADSIVTFKAAVKTIAKRHGMHATFLPKPLTDAPGSGLHLNLTLCRGSENAFAATEGISPTAKQFIAGVFSHIGAITALANPLVNSYKRLVSGAEAPLYIAWASQNSSPLIRVPAHSGADTCIELRSPDPACNPYLAIAAILAAGIDGIRRGLTPPPGAQGNIMAMTDEQRAALGIGSLPTSLYEAVKALRRDELILDLIGGHIAEKYIDAKTLEWERYSNTVHQWELDQYLRAY